MRRRIQEAWETFARMAVPKGASFAQHADMRGAFFVGALELFSMITGNLTESSEPEERDLQMMDEIYNELHEFKTTILSRVPNA